MNMKIRVIYIYIYIYIYIKDLYKEGSLLRAKNRTEM